MADTEVVRSYVEDLREVLSNSPLPEQKAFIRSFVKEVRATGKEVLLIYTMPLPPEGSLQETAGVLDTVHFGEPRLLGKGERRLENHILPCQIHTNYRDMLSSSLLG